MRIWSTSYLAMVESGWRWLAWQLLLGSLAPAWHLFWHHITVHERWQQQWESAAPAHSDIGKIKLIGANNTHIISTLQQTQCHYPIKIPPITPRPNPTATTLIFELVNNLRILELSRFADQDSYRWCQDWHVVSEDPKQTMKASNISTRIGSKMWVRYLLDHTLSLSTYALKLIWYDSNYIANPFETI